MDPYASYEPLLAARVPPESVATGRAYVIHARNGGVGVAVRVDGRLGYRLRRVKFERVYLFTEWDWAEGEPYGTAIASLEIAEDPPADDDALIEWLAAKEEEHRALIDAAWRVVLPSVVFDALGR